MLRTGIGPRTPALGLSYLRLRHGKYIRYRGGIGPLRPAPPIGPVVAKLDPRVGRGAGDDSGSRAVGEVGKSPVHQDAKFVAKTD